MIDLYLEACYATDTKQQEKRAFVEALKKLPNDELMKVAQTGKIAHFGCDDEKETWLDRYKGTPLFDQAVAIEQQNLQLEAQRLQEDQERRKLHPIEDTIWQQQDQLRLQRRLLDLQLAQLGQQQLTGAPAMPEGAPQGAGAPGPESAPVGVEVAPKTAASKMHHALIKEASGEALEALKASLKRPGAVAGLIGGGAGNVIGGVAGYRNAKENNSGTAGTIGRTLLGAAIGGHAGSSIGHTVSALGHLDPNNVPKIASVLMKELIEKTALLGSMGPSSGGAFGKLKGMFGGGGASAPVELGLRGTPGGTVAHNPGYAAALRAGPTQSWMKPTGSWGTPYKTAEANAAYMMKLMEKSAALDFASLKKGLQTAGQGLAHTGVHKPALMGAGIGALAGGVGGALSTDEQGHHSLGRALTGAAGGAALGGAAGAVHHNYGRSSAADIGGKLQDAFNTTGNQAKAAVGTTMSGGKPPVIPKSAPHPTVAATHGMPGMTQPGPAVMPPGQVPPTQAIPASQPIPAQQIRPSGVAPTVAFDQARPTPVRLRAA